MIHQNNDYHLSVSDYIRMFIVGTVIAIFLTISFDFLSMKIGWSFSYFDILTGYFTGSVVLKIARYGSEKVGIISVVCYLLGTLFTPILTYYIFWNQSVSLTAAIQLALGQFSNLFSLVFIKWHFPVLLSKTPTILSSGLKLTILEIISLYSGELNSFSLNPGPSLLNIF